MAFKSNFGSNMCHCLLIALIILIIHDISFSSSVSGDDQSNEGVNKSLPIKHVKPNKLKKAQRNGAIGSTGTIHINDSLQETSARNLKNEEKDQSTHEKPPNSDGSEKLGWHNSANEEEVEDIQGFQELEEIQPNRPGSIHEEKSSAMVPKLHPPSEDTSSAGSFMTYFVVAAVVIIIAYLVFHNKKKLLAYIVEGRNTGRSRRQRATSGTEYKPLKNVEEASGCRPESA